MGICTKTGNSVGVPVSPSRNTICRRCQWASERSREVSHRPLCDHGVWRAHHATVPAQRKDPITFFELRVSAEHKCF